MFQIMRLNLGTKEIENINHCGEASSILNFVTTNEAFKKESGEMTGWIPDTGDGKADVMKQN